MSAARPFVKLSDAAIIRRIRVQQLIQRRHPPTSERWLLASDALRPLFEEMRRRHPKGESS